MTNNEEYTIISLVGKQSIPNILFINYMTKEKEKQFKEYIFVYTDKTCKIKEKMNKFLKDKYKKAIFKDCYIKDSAYFNGIKNELKEMLEQIEDKTHIMFNITGGTTIMACALFDVAFEFNKEHGLSNNNVYYIYGNKIYKIKENSKEDEFDIPKDLLNVEDYFKAVIETRFTKIQNLKDYDTIKNFAKEVINNKYFLDNIKKYNEKACKIEKIENIPKLEQQSKLQDLLQEFKDKILKKNIISTEKILEQNLKNKNTEEQIKFLIHNNWLEEYVYYNILHNISLKENLETKYIADTKVSINTELIIDPDLDVPKKYKTKNEIDVCFIHENNLYLIECKTNIPKDYEKVIDKLKYVQSKMGTFVKATLIILDYNFKSFDSKLKSKLTSRLKEEKIAFLTFKTEYDDYGEEKEVDLYTDIIEKNKEFED